MIAQHHSIFVLIIRITYFFPPCLLIDVGVLVQDAFLFLPLLDSRDSCISTDTRSPDLITCTEEALANSFVALGGF